MFPPRELAERGYPMGGFGGVSISPETGEAAIGDARYKGLRYDREWGIEREEEKPHMKKQHDIIKGTRSCTVACDFTEDLQPDKILKNLSIMKSELYMELVPARVGSVECCMTPAVKRNLITAGRRLAMYGKKPPIIARFDEYGRRLPDQINLETLQGVTIKIVDPDLYGELYLSFKGYQAKTDEDTLLRDPEDLTFWERTTTFLKIQK